MKNYRKKLVELLYEYGFTTSSWQDIWSYNGIGQFLTIKDADKIVELPTEFECSETGYLVIKSLNVKHLKYAGGKNLANRGRYHLTSWTTNLKFRYDQPAEFEKMKEHIKFLMKNLEEARLDCKKWQLESLKIQHMEEIETASEGWEV